MSEQAAIANLNASAASGSILAKLIVFTISLGFVPIASYFVSLRYIWNGNTTYAALTAIIAANLILAAYIILSFLEDKNSLRSPKNSQSARVSTDSRKDK